MERDIYLKKIEERICCGKHGKVYITSDFCDIASKEVAQRALSRLAEDGKIRRIMRGVYDYPEYNAFLQENVVAAPDKVAHAIARNYGWTIVPCGDTALNVLGLSTQVPSAWVYVSNGKYVEYTYENITLRFKHTANKEISTVSEKTALIIQAIKALGSDNINYEIIEKLSLSIDKSEKKKMLLEAKYTTAWIYEIIKDICKRGADE